MTRRLGMRAPIMCVAALWLFGCGRGEPPPAPTEDATTETVAPDAAAPLPEVDAALLADPNSAFTAVEPSEVGVFGAPTVREALSDIVAGAHEEGGELQLSIRETGETAVADIVRTGMGDDSVSAGHVRVEFHREPEGWFATNAYRRWMCARGAQTNQWTTTPCP